MACINSDKILKYYASINIVKFLIAIAVIVIFFATPNFPIEQASEEEEETEIDTIAKNEFNLNNLFTIEANDLKETQDFNLISEEKEKIRDKNGFSNDKIFTYNKILRFYIGIFCIVYPVFLVLETIYVFVYMIFYSHEDEQNEVNKKMNFYSAYQLFLTACCLVPFIISILALKITHGNKVLTQEEIDDTYYQYIIYITFYIFFSVMHLTKAIFFQMEKCLIFRDTKDMYTLE